MRTAIPLADKLLFTGVLIHCEQHLVPTDLEELQVAVDARMNSVMVTHITFLSGLPYFSRKE